ncbi:MAG: hypothetical protein KJZ83_18810 [Burkholderiaceae bacterium]|nr:hypothetical protein [Burkholderiaceae bacterium]
MIDAGQLAAVLRDLIDGKREIRLKDPRRPWVQVAVGEVAFVSGDLTLVLYADCASLEHVVSAQPAGGEASTYEHWLMRDGANPVELLDDSERVALEQVLTQTA